MLWSEPVKAGNEAEVKVSKHSIELVKIGRAIVSDQTGDIDDPSKSY